MTTARTSALLCLVGMLGLMLDAACSSAKRRTTKVAFPMDAATVEADAAMKRADAGHYLQDCISCDEAAARKTSVGCDYWPVQMDMLAPHNGSCFAAVVANTCSDPAHLHVSFDGSELDLAALARIPRGAGKALRYEPIDPARGVPPGDVAILFLAGPLDADALAAGAVACPITPQRDGRRMLSGTGIERAFHLVSDVPVVVTQIYPYGGAAASVTGASLLLPSSAWGTDYIVFDALAEQMGTAGPTVDIVASRDTTLRLLPSVDILGGGGVAPAPAHKALTIQLQAGHYLQLSQIASLTGSVLRTDQPVGYFAGHACADVPFDTLACDHLEQQIAPVNAWGNEYAAAGYRPRKDVAENMRWRFIGAAEDTHLTFEPSIAGAPTTLKLGESIELTSDVPFVVRSQDAAHPFFLAAYMSGWGNLEPPGSIDARTSHAGYGDPDFVTIVTPSQWLNDYVFFTDPTYPETNLVFVRQKQAEVFADVVLDCLGKLDGWRAIDDSGHYEMTRVDLVRHDFVAQGHCNNGRHRAYSAAPFGLTVWGWGTPETDPNTGAVSYGYPAGLSAAAINPVVIAPD